MKKNVKWLAIIATFVTVLFTSCNNGLNNATISGPGYGEKNVTLYASSDSNIVLFTNPTPNPASRDIIPETIDATDSDNYKFYLWGEDKLGIISNAATLATPSTVTFSPESGSKTKGTVNLDLEVSQYELHLAVLPAGAATPTTGNAAKNAAILYATAIVDFRSSDSVNFFLSPYKLSAGGGFALKLYADGAWTVPATHEIIVGVYDINTGSVANGVTEKKSTDSPAFALPTTAPSEDNFKSDGEKSVKPGTYNFIFELAPTAASGLTKHYYYSERIVILSNQVTKATIAIPDILTKKPTDPEKLGVSFIDPLTADSNTYEVQFTWEDKSYNEEYFQLELLDITKLTDANLTALASDLTALAAATGAKDSGLDSNWEKLRDSTYTSNETLYTFNKYIYEDTTKGDYFYGNPNFWVDGSMTLNSTYAVLRLDLGHKYLARLCAVNDVGNSNYLYADITGTTVTSSVNYKRYDITSVNSTTLKKFGASNEINRFRITYNLNEGTFYNKTQGAIDPKDTPPVAATTVDGLNPNKDAIVKYGTHKATGTSDISKILNPLEASDAPTPTSYSILFDGDMNRWTNWLVGGVSGTIYTVSSSYTTNSKASPTPSFSEAEYLGYENLDLYATYRITGGSAKVDESANYNIRSDMVKVYYSPTSTVTLPTTPTAATAPVKGVYQFVNSATTDANNPGIDAAKTIFVALVNDGTNNYVKGTPVSYDKVTMKVLRNGNTPKLTATASEIATIAYTDGKLSDGTTASATASANYVPIKISSFPAGKYAVQIHAYANTQQGEYTYTLYFEVRDPSGAAATPTFVSQTKTFQFSDIASPSGTPGAITSITGVTPNDATVLNASFAGSTVTIESKKQGSATVDLSDGTNTMTVTFTVGADGSISVTGITLH